MKTQYIEINPFGTFYWRDKAMTKLHREDGPAKQLTDGTTMWYFNNKLHRTNGPAVEYPNEYPDYYPHGFRAWYIHGVRCRVDGPAIENADGVLWWYINGNRVTEQEHRDFYNPPKPKTININGKEFTVEELKSLIKTAEENKV